MATYKITAVDNWGVKGSKNIEATDKHQAQKIALFEIVLTKNGTVANKKMTVRKKNQPKNQ